MPGLTLAELPTEVATVVQDVAAYLGVSVGDLFVADHEHEMLSPGSFSIAFEGAYEWPYEFSSRDEVRRSYPGLFLEPGTGWYLGVYPDQD